MGDVSSRAERAKSYRRAERERVKHILDRDAADRRAEQRRDQAELEIAEGKFINLDDTVVPPTPEQLAKGDYMPYTPNGKDGTVRSVKTVRRLIVNQITYLYSRGLLDNDLFSACRWYRERYDAAQMDPSAGVASYGESVRGDVLYGHLPSTAWAAEARSEFRWARTFVPSDVIGIFDPVVLHDQTLSDAAARGGTQFRNTRAAFLRGALALHGGIAARLKIDPPSTDIEDQEE